MNDHDQPRLETIDSNGWRLRVQFERCGDRYGHRVSLIHGERSLPLLESIEGDDQTLWPSSPPLQQLSFHRQNGRESVALLVGMAGKSHWSLSLEIDPERPEIVFDVACRAGQSPERLASSYRSAVALRASSNLRAVWMDSPAGELLLVVEPVGGQDVAEQAIAAEEMARIESSGSGIAIVAAAAGSAVLPVTVRWKYRLGLPT